MTNESKTSSSAIDSHPLCSLHSSIIPTEHRPSNSQLQLRETKTIATRRDQTKTIPSQAAGSLPYSGSLVHSCLVSRDGQSRFIAPARLVCLRVRACQGASPANAAHLSATLTH